MTCFDINMEEKWTYSWDWGNEGAKIPPKKRVGAILVVKGAFKGRRWSVNVKRLFIGTYL